MDRNARSHHRQTLGGVQSRARRAQAVDYFNILTSPELLDIRKRICQNIGNGCIRRR
jgi:hypothetical protein